MLDVFQTGAQGEVGETAVRELSKWGLVGHGNESGFHSKCNGKPLGVFKQGDIQVIRPDL